MTESATLDSDENVLSPAVDRSIACGGDRRAHAGVVELTKFYAGLIQNEEGAPLPVRTDAFLHASEEALDDRELFQELQLNMGEDLLLRDLRELED
ncbi:MAG: hypothetical protein V3W41_21235 [Planctomycetota bacterium]